MSIDNLETIIEHRHQSRMINPGDLVKYEPDPDVVAAWYGVGLVLGKYEPDPDVVAAWYGVGLVLGKDVSEPPFQTVSVLWSGPRAPVRLMKVLSIEQLRRYNDV